MKRTGFLHVISGAIGSVRCSVGLHPWCRHPSVESDVIRNEIVFRCQQCGCVMEREVTGKFVPRLDYRVCTRCGTVA
jgi:hypothetical protein